MKHLKRKTLSNILRTKIKTISYNLFKEYFNVATPPFFAKQLFETKNKNKNSEYVELTKVKWSNLKDEIEENV